MILFSDLHLRPESEDVCFAVLDKVAQTAFQNGDDREIVFLGDFWQVRYALPVRLLNQVRAVFKAWTQQHRLKLWMVPGNHDQYDVSGNNALEVFGDIPGVKVLSEPQYVPELDAVALPYRKDPRVLLDWIKDHGQSVSFSAIGLLHHGIVGAYMNNGMQAGPNDGIAEKDLPFRLTFCGHWHRHQTVGLRCVYVGSPWQTRSDEAGQIKGVIQYRHSKWKFIPIDVGKHFHVIKEFSEEEIRKISGGDVVRVPAGTSQATVNAILKLGAEVLVAPAIPETHARFGGKGTLREYAREYVDKAVAEGAEREEMMAIFDEMMDHA